MTFDIAAQAPFDIRAIYLAGGLFDGLEPCTSCASDCTTAGRSCANASREGCSWWGCWQWDKQPPGQYLRDFLAQTRRLRQIPLLTYYQLLQTARVPEGPRQIAALADKGLTARYFNDWRFLLRIVGETPVMLHLEPDLWAFAQRVSADPRKLRVAVRAGNPTDCAELEDNLNGFARCLIRMARRYAPHARIALHASSWGTGSPALHNHDPAADVTADARRLGDFLLAIGAKDGDFLAIDVSDRDAGFHASQGKRTWWDPTNKDLPHFRQAFTWASALHERTGLPLLWWNVPLGHMGLDDRPERWRDNRVDYFLSHMDEVAAAGGIGVTFGAGAQGQTTPATDEGNLVRKARAYATEQPTKAVIPNSGAAGPAQPVDAGKAAPSKADAAGSREQSGAHGTKAGTAGQRRLP